MNNKTKQAQHTGALSMLPAMGLLLFGAIVVAQEYNEANPIIQTITKTITKYQVDTEIVYIDREVYLPDPSPQSSSYWMTLVNIESGGGKNMKRPTARGKNCDTTTLPCGYHQLSKLSLIDLGLKGKALTKAMKDRHNFKKSQALALRYNKRLTQLGCDKQDQERYVCWNQGAVGGMYIMQVAEQGGNLSKGLIRNMANNSPYSRKSLAKLSGKRAAKKFLKYRKALWLKKLIKL